LATIKDYTLRLCKGLGYDFNTVEFAVRDGIPYAIDLEIQHQMQTLIQLKKTLNG
jgi:hypothetical protein